MLTNPTSRSSVADRCGPAIRRRSSRSQWDRWGLPAALLMTVLLIAGPARAASATDNFSRALSQGPLAAALAAFAGGLLVSLTPCVYPMVAVTVSVFGARKAQSRWQGLALTTAFVLGMVVMFVALGLMAALTGSVFGSVLQSRWVVIGISVLFVVMALSMFGAFELSLPSALLNRLATVGGIGYRGAFLLGLVSGLVASPCTGPVLTGILAWIATTKDLWLGSLAMSCFALGLGVPFFAVGAFALELPKSGRWMMSIKTVLGTVLLIVAFYFAGTTLPWLQRLVPHGSLGWASAGALAGLGAVLVLLSRGKRALSVAAISAFVLAGFCTTTKLTRSESSLKWQHVPLLQAMQEARALKQPLLVDFTATWCGACKELEKRTFSAESVKAYAGRFYAVKVDATHDDDEGVTIATQRLNVKGLPTVVLMDAEGREVTRFTDFVAPDTFLQALKQVP